MFVQYLLTVVTFSHDELEPALAPVLDKPKLIEAEFLREAVDFHVVLIDDTYWLPLYTADTW